jgi:putative PIN family toxin of toxin-antitoxin system
MTPTIVLDTNVLVAGVLSPFGPPGRLLDLLLSGELNLAYDDRIAAEYRQVLARPKFHLNPAAVRDLLDALLTAGEPVIARPLAITLPDPDDLAFLEVASQAGAPLVTGNLCHFPPETWGSARVYAPAAFLQSWQDAQVDGS